MPYSIKHGEGPRPWKIIDDRTGKQVGSSKTKQDAYISKYHRMKND